MALKAMVFSLLLALASLELPAAAAATAAKAAQPRFKWGQTKDTLFLSVMIRDLDSASVAVSLPSEGDLSFKAKNAQGKDFALELPLREDVKVETLKWEVQARSDKWGTVVLIILGKKNEHRWDLLVTEPKKFKGIMDKDWVREDQTLEPEEELPYVEDNSAYLTELTEKNMEKMLQKFGAVVVNVRYPWCSQCKSQDDTFAKAAKLVKGKAKKDAAWKKLAFAVVDAREQRGLARVLGAKCDYSCEYRVFSEPGEPPVSIKSKWSEAELVADLAKYLSPAVQLLESAGDIEAIKEKNTTCLGGFASESSPQYAVFKRVAGIMRGELVFAATIGKESAIELWPHKQSFSFKYDGDLTNNDSALVDWIRPRSIPLLQVYDWQLRDTYEKLGLPIAKVWLDESEKNPSFDKIVRHAVRRVAKMYVGRLAFVENKKAAYSYELRDFGLNQPEVYPAFGIASNGSYSAIKYGFEITPAIAPSVQEFWTDADAAIEKLMSFCDQVLAGTWPEAHESGPRQTNWTAGMVKQLAWKTYSEIESPETPLILQLYSKYRQDNERKLKEVENLAKALEPHSAALLVASYDSADNYLPGGGAGEFKRERFSSDTEWFFVPAKAAGAERGVVKKLTKPKKDADIKTVLEFAKKQAGLDLDVEAINLKFETLMVENPPPTTTTPPMPTMGGDGTDSDLGSLGGLDGFDGLNGLQGKEL